MSITRRLATGMSAAALATCGLVAAGTGLATAAPAKYPGGSPKVGFNHHTYHRGQHVHAKSGKHFKKHDDVKEILVCRHHHHNHRRHLGHDQANHNGVVKTSFTLHSKDYGTCTLIVKGHGATSQGTFKANK